MILMFTSSLFNGFGVLGIRGFMDIGFLVFGDSGILGYRDLWIY